MAESISRARYERLATLTALVGKLNSGSLSVADQQQARMLLQTCRDRAMQDEGDSKVDWDAVANALDEGRAVEKKVWRSLMAQVREQNVPPVPAADAIVDVVEQTCGACGVDAASHEKQTRANIAWCTRQISEIPSGGITISSPGVYCVSRPLSFTGPGTAITITSSNVTLDFRGFELAVTGGATGVSVTGTLSNLTIKNGVLRDCGVSISMTGGSNEWLVEDMRIITGFAGAIGILVSGAGDHGTIQRVWGISTAGTTSRGITLTTGSSYSIRDCMMVGWGSDGFRVTPTATGSLVNCQSGSNGGRGFATGDRVLLSNCVASVNTGIGIAAAGNGTLVEQCVVNDNGGIGIDVANAGAMLYGCVARESIGNNIELDDHCAAILCATQAGNAQGITAAGTRCFLSECVSINATTAGFSLVSTSSGTVCQDCVAVVPNGRGFENTAALTTESDMVLRRCGVVSSGSDGIRMPGRTTLRDCVVNRTSGAAVTGIITGINSVLQQCIVSGPFNSGGFAGDVQATSYQDCSAVFTTTGFSMSTTGNGPVLQRCIANSNGGNGFDCVSGNECVFQDCIAAGSSADGFSTAAAADNGTFQGCVTVDSGTHGFELAGDRPSLNRCVAFRSGTDGFHATTGITVAEFIDCVATNNTGDGFDLGSAGGIVVRDCVSVGHTGVGDAGFRTSAVGRPAPRRYASVGARNTASWVGTWSGADAFGTDPITTASIFTSWINVDH